MQHCHQHSLSQRRTYRKDYPSIEQTESLDTDQSLSDALYAQIDISGYPVMLSANWQHITGWSQTELMSLPIVYQIHPDDVLGFINNVHALYQGEATTTFTCRFECQDGTYLRLDWQATINPEQLLITLLADVVECSS